VASVERVDGGWSGDWWDSEEGLADGESYPLPRAGLYAVPFHHYTVDASGRRLTVFWNGLAFCEPGPATAEEREDGVIVTVTELRASDVIAPAGQGRRTTLALERPLGNRPVWDRWPGVRRPHAFGGG
jgi:hypothetical protein